MGVQKRDIGIRMEQGSPVVGYVRCPLSPDYGRHKDGREAQSLTPSTCAFNPFYVEQHKKLRRHARSLGMHLARVFYDLEEPRALELHERTELVRLFVEINLIGARTVLVEKEEKLCDEPLLAGLLLRYFLSQRIEVVDASSGSRLTSKRCAKDRLAGRDAGEISHALRLFRRFKGEVTRAKNKSKVGRKAFGGTGQELRCLLRLRTLCSLLPRDEWKRRGGCLQTRRSYRQIADILNAEGYETRQGNPWAPRTVQGLVKREWPGIYAAWSRPVGTRGSKTSRRGSGRR